MASRTVVALMTLAVTNVFFMAMDTWHRRADGVAMGSLLAVVLANLWMKKFDPDCRRQTCF